MGSMVETGCYQAMGQLESTCSKTTHTRLYSPTAPSENINPPVAPPPNDDDDGNDDISAAPFGTIFVGFANNPCDAEE
jgi:hypothetical protein